MSKTTADFVDKVFTHGADFVGDVPLTGLCNTLDPGEQWGNYAYQEPPVTKRKIFDVDNTELGENQAPESMPQMRAGVSKLSMALRVCGRRPSRWSTRTSAESLTSSMAKSPLPQKHLSISSAASRGSLMGSATTTPPKVVKVGFGGRKPRMGLAGDPVV